LRAFGLNELLKVNVSSANATYAGDAASTQRKIDKLDKQWIAGDTNDPFVQRHITGNVAAALKAYRNNFSGNAEVFIIDKYGALVAANNRTSDYKQSDEDWWQVAWNEGKGGVYLGEPAFDESSQPFSVNIAVPIYEGNPQQQVIGILRTTFSLSQLAKLIDNVRFGDTGRAYMLLPTGTVLESGGAKAMPVDARTLTHLQTAAATDYTETDFGNIPSLISQAAVGNGHCTRPAIRRNSPATGRPKG
jgi:hypothetical protein